MELAGAEVTFQIKLGQVRTTGTNLLHFNFLAKGE